MCLPCHTATLVLALGGTLLHCLHTTPLALNTITFPIVSPHTYSTQAPYSHKYLHYTPTMIIRWLIHTTLVPYTFKILRCHSCNTHTHTRLCHTLLTAPLPPCWASLPCYICYTIPLSIRNQHHHTACAPSSFSPLYPCGSIYILTFAFLVLVLLPVD